MIHDDFLSHPLSNPLNEEDLIEDDELNIQPWWSITAYLVASHQTSTSAVSQTEIIHMRGERVVEHALLRPRERFIPGIHFASMLQKYWYARKNEVLLEKMSPELSTLHLQPFMKGSLLLDGQMQSVQDFIHQGQKHAITLAGTDLAHLLTDKDRYLVRHIQNIQLVPIPPQHSLLTWIFAAWSVFLLNTFIIGILAILWVAGHQN